MNVEVEQVMEQLERMDAPARAEIAHRLLTTLRPEEPDYPQEFEAELDRRIDEIKSGRAVGRAL